MERCSVFFFESPAMAMDTSLPTCKSRLRLAREKLRQKLRERGLAVRESVPSDSESSDSEN